MSFLISENQVSFMNTNSVKLEKKIPIGIYKIAYNKFQGTYLEKTEIKLSHGKIYGKSQSYANHVCESFRKRKSDSLQKDMNLGVLFSGGRGLGKTLTTRLIIDKLKDEFPIILVSSYTPDLPDFLNVIQDSIIVIDEYEKLMGGTVDGNNEENSVTKQDTFLPILDGSSGSKGNLFLLTVNETNVLSENIFSRPGRILYHYNYKSEKNDVIEAYCLDNLERKELIPEIIEVLSASKYVSMDIITAFVQELNNFKDLSPFDVKEYFNIEQNTNYILKVFAIVRGLNVEYECELESLYSYEFSKRWLKMTNKSRGLIEKSNLFEEDEDGKLYPKSIRFSASTEAFPSYVIGSVEIDVNAIEVDLANDDFDYTEIKLVKAVLFDKSASLYTTKKTAAL